MLYHIEIEKVNEVPQSFWGNTLTKVHMLQKDKFFQDSSRDGSFHLFSAVSVRLGGLGNVKA